MKVVHPFQNTEFYLHLLALILLLTLSPSFLAVLLSCTEDTLCHLYHTPLPLSRACSSNPLSPTVQEPSHYLPQACELGPNCASGGERKVLYAAKRS